MIIDLVKKSRSYRRFYESRKIDKEVLKNLIELARFSPSALNLQRLRFFCSNEDTTNQKIFDNAGFAGYLGPQGRPAEGQRPAAYILLLSTIEPGHNIWTDAGIACQSILLGATERGLGGCIIGSIKKTALQREFNIPPELHPLLAVALGKPAATVKTVDINDDGNTKYWRDKAGVHFVPKRKTEDLIVEF